MLNNLPKVLLTMTLELLGFKAKQTPVPTLYPLSYAASSSKKEVPLKPLGGCLKSELVVG